MKIKATRKDVMNSFAKVIEIGFADAQYMLTGLQPIAYTAGTLGWNADVYDVGRGVAIVTGSRPFGNVHPSYDVVREFENAARRNYNDGDINFELFMKKNREIMRDFIGTVVK